MPAFTLTVHIDDRPPCDHRVEIALEVARRLDATVVGTYALFNPTVPEDWSGGLVSYLAHSAGVAHEAFAARADSAGVAHDWRQVRFGQDIDILDQVVDALRFGDLAVIGQAERDRHGAVRELPEQVVLRTGRPVLTIPFVGAYPTVGRRPMIAWNGGREATRALFDGLPLVTGADTATVLAFERDGSPMEVSQRSLEEVEALLARHGLDTDRRSSHLVDIGIADAMLSLAADLAADLLVMGAHGHYGRPHLVRGSVTKAILEQMTLPVLLSH